MSAFVAISVFIVTVVFVVWLGRHFVIMDILDVMVCFLRFIASLNWSYCQPG